jgi:hypothetical protein
VTEIGAADGSTNVELTADEIAARLSYLLTSGPPDDALIQQAALGALVAPEGREAEAHQYMTRSFDWEDKLAGTVNAATWLPLPKYNRYVYGKVARLMQRLDELGAFDNVLIYATSELGNPNAHSSSGVPTVLAGGVNVPFRFGRRIQVTPDCLPPNDSCVARDAKYAGGASNHLLVSIAQAFGAEIDSFGQGADGSYTTSALPGLT